MAALAKTAIDGRIRAAPATNATPAAHSRPRYPTPPDRVNHRRKDPRFQITAVTTMTAPIARMAHGSTAVTSRLASSANEPPNPLSDIAMANNPTATAAESMKRLSAVIAANTGAVRHARDFANATRPR